jgi:hypothetical protein
MFGQDVAFFKATGKKDLHYLEFSDGNVKVYKMGLHYDKAGSGAAIILTDTLFLFKGEEFKGKHYTLFKNGIHYTLVADNGKKYAAEPEDDLNKVNSELNNAYYLKSYFDLSDKLNREFPLNHYSFRNGYYAWQKHPGKTISHNKFMKQTDKETASIYDSIFIKQTALIRTTSFITDNVGHEEYSNLKDSISTLPNDYRPQSGYFDKSVYHMAKSNPEYFYRLLQDFPERKTLIYHAVQNDKELVEELRHIQGYDDLKRGVFQRV